MLWIFFLLFYRHSSAGLTWAPPALMRASPRDAPDAYGSALALSQDGLVLVVGAPFEASGDPGNSSDNTLSGAGAAYVFSRPDAASAWGPPQYLKPPTPVGNLSLIHI